MITKKTMFTLIFICFQANLVYAMEQEQKRQHNVKYAELAIVQAMIQAGADLEKEDEYGERPLHWAVYRGMPGLIRALIESGVDANAKNKRGLTALKAYNEGPVTKTVQEEEFKKFYYPENREAVLTALITTVSPQELSRDSLPVIVTRKMALAKSWLAKDTDQDAFRQEILQSCDRILAKTSNK